MVTGIIQGLLPTILFTLSVTTPYNSSATLQATTSAEISQSRPYVVSEGDTLASIAESTYGDIEFWKLVWNDNDWIEDPHLIEKTWILKIRSAPPTDPEELKPELEKKLTARIVPTQPIQAQVPVVSQSQVQIQPQAVVYSGTGPLNEAQITFLGNCESGMRPATNTGNGFYGAFQFTIGTWNSMKTGYERADLAPLEVQIDAVQRLLTRSSIWTQFPGCAAKMRSLGII